MTQAQGSTGRLLAGRYRLNEVLGRGGMGTVWRAEDEVLGRIVAVKELRMHGGVDEEEKHRLIVRTLREAKATARIRHTAAVTVFDVVEEDDRPWIVMELVESRSLAEVIKEDGPLKPGRAAEIAIELLGVLGAAHSHGILHRDVKPSNVLIGDDGRVVLTDFGIASVEGDTSVTSTGMLVGAPSYISPERARGQKPGPPADMWSLGGTLYAMVEGRPPYDRGSALATLTAVMTEELATPEKAGALRPVIEGLLEKDPARRLDASTTRSMLKRIVADETAKAESTTQVTTPPVVAAEAAPEEPVEAKRGVGGLLGTVRVGSRAAEPVAPVPVPVPVPVPEPVLEPAPATEMLSAVPPGRGRRPVVLAGIAVVVVLLLIVVAILLRDSGGTTGGAGSADAVRSPAAVTPSAPAASAASGSSGAKPAETTASKPATSPSPAASSAGSTAAAPTSAVPAGFREYRDGSGFSIVLPEWMVDKGEDYDDTSRRFEGRGVKLVVDWTQPAHGSAVDDWVSSEQDLGASNYQRITLQAITYRQWTNAADWEWTFGSRTKLHSLNRGFVTGNGKYGYALYWTMPDADWNAADNVQARQKAFDSFQPAP